MLRPPQLRTFIKSISLVPFRVYPSVFARDDIVSFKRFLSKSISLSTISHSSSFIHGHIADTNAHLFHQYQGFFSKPILHGLFLPFQLLTV